MITEVQEVLLRDLRKSHAPLAEAEKVIHSMEGLTDSERQLALKLHIPYAQQASKTVPVPIPPPVAEPNEIVSSAIPHKRPKPKKSSFISLGFWVVAVGLIVLFVFVIFGKPNRGEKATDLKQSQSKTLSKATNLKQSQSKTLSKALFGYSSLKGVWHCASLTKSSLDFRADGSIVENGIVSGNKWGNETVVLNVPGPLFEQLRPSDPYNGPMLFLLNLCFYAKDEDVVLRDSTGRIIGTGLLPTLRKLTPDKRREFTHMGRGRDVAAAATKQPKNVLIEVTIHQVDDDHFDIGPFSFVREGKH